MGYTFILPDDNYTQSPGTMLPIPKHQLNFELDWEIESTGLRVEIENKLVSSQITPDNPSREKAPPYVLWGMTLEYRFAFLKVFGGIENVGDFQQYDSGPLWGPRQGREFYLGIKNVL